MDALEGTLGRENIGALLETTTETASRVIAESKRKGFIQLTSIQSTGVAQLHPYKVEISRAGSFYWIPLASTIDSSD